MLQSRWTSGTHPTFIKIPQSVCHPLSKPTEGPCFPGQVFNTQWCSCHQSGDSVKSHSVRNCRKKDPTSPSLRAQVLKNLDPDTPPKPWECSLLLQEFQVNAILGEKKVNKIKVLSWQSTFCVGTLQAVLGKPSKLSHTVILVPIQGRKWIRGETHDFAKCSITKSEFLLRFDMALASRAEASEYFIKFNVRGCFHF